MLELDTKTLQGMALFVVIMTVSAFVLIRDYKQNKIAKAEMESLINNDSREMLEIQFKLSDSKFGNEGERDNIHLVTDKLSQIIQESNTGEFDGDEFGEGMCSLYMLGESATEIYESIKSYLLSSGLASEYKVSISAINGNKHREFMENAID